MPGADERELPSSHGALRSDVQTLDPSSSKDESVLDVRTTISQDRSENHDVLTEGSVRGVTSDTGLQEKYTEDFGEDKTTKFLSMRSGASLDPSEDATWGQQPPVIQVTPEEAPKRRRFSRGEESTDEQTPATSEDTSLLDGELWANDAIALEPDIIAKKVTAILGSERFGSNPTSQLFQYLLTTILKLQAEKKLVQVELEKALNPEVPETAQQGEDETITQVIPPDDADPILETFHMVYCGDQPHQYFRDVPRKFKGDSKYDHLRGLLEVENMSKYLDEHRNTSFAVIEGHDCDKYREESFHRVLVGFKAGKLIQDAPLSQPDSQQLVIGTNARSGLKAIYYANLDRFKGYRVADMGRALEEPYTFFYAHNRTLMELEESTPMEDKYRAAIKLLCQWFEDNWRADWDEADALLAKGKINAKHIRKLFRPDELLVSHKEGVVWTYKTKSYPWVDTSDKAPDVLMWSFNGYFSQSSFAMSVMEPTFLNPKTGDVDITSLKSYPIRFDSPVLYDQLIARGEKFWNCRKMRLVCYRDTDEVDPSQAERRLMVDYDIYRRLHPKKDMFWDLRDDIGEDAMNAKEPPSGDFLALLPPFIHAFDLHGKYWARLRADRITDVTWNKDAFKRLVVADETKELIQALVTAHSDRLRSAPDIIAGKGNGLLILLHGGPGTGKTLTAESIAELQERPLYRVTCGDIGTEPDAVEAYLSTVLHIGKSWGCVVLLDEADVFIEERSLADLKRNAIISVFLRVLEYYDGILIITTNRVGTFDEAFKSRISLALRYPNLDQQQRREIWCNFFQLLAAGSGAGTGAGSSSGAIAGGPSSSEERVDRADLEMNVDRLATIEINGRQIRNAITTARHLARFRRERLVYRHVQHAIATVTKFDEYLMEVKGVSDDGWAREDKLR